MTTITLTKEDIKNPDKTFNALKKIAVLEKIDGSIDNNTITYNQEKFDSLNLDEELKNIQPRIEMLNPDKEPKFKHMKVDNVYLFTIDYEEINKKEKFHKRVEPIELDQYPSEIKIIDLDPNISEEGKVYYMAFIAVLVKMGKDLDQEKITLTNEEKIELFKVKSQYNNEFLNINKYKVCFKENIIGEYLLRIPFRGKEYYIAESQNCDMSKVDKN